MTTYRELVYLCLDELKLVSDDSHFQPEHILFLLDKFRTFILNQKYKDIKKEIPESNFQTICLDLEEVPAFEGDTCGGRGYLRSVQKIPNMVTISNPKVSTTDYFTGNITYVNRERFKYVGNNKYLQNIIYSTIAPNEHLYLKSSNVQYSYLEKVRLTGVFEDSAAASALSCDADGEGACDVMDRDFPLEEGLISTLVELVVKELSGFKYQAADQQNNANDDLETLAAYIRQQMALGRRSDLYKEH